MNRITQTVFAEEQGGLSLSAIVERNWIALNLDATVDAAVDAATERVMKETGYWDRFISGWSPSKAEELTEDVAEYAFESPDFHEAFQLLSQNISDDVAAEIRLMASKSASSALLCVQTFIGDGFSPTMAAVLEELIQTRLDENRKGPAPEVSWLDIAEANPVLLSGVGVIIGSQIARSLGKVLARRIAGQIVRRILTGAIPLVGTLIGAGLIVWDLFNARQGSLPMIRDALQEPEIKEEIRTQVVREVGKELRVELPQLARSVSNHVYSQWQEFRRKYSRVLDLAENHPRFRSILDSTAVEDVQKLANFATLVEDRFGLERLTTFIDAGHFERLLGLPEKVLLILSENEDPAVAIDWADLAGDLLTEVIETELYRTASPTDFRDRADLGRVLALVDAELIQKLMRLDVDVRDTVLSLPTTHITQILDSLSTEELTWLSRDYLAVLENRMRNVLVDRILRQPELKAELNARPVRGALLESEDFERSLNYVGQRTGERLWMGKVVEMLAAIGPALSGDLPLTLFWHYDGRVFLNVLYALAGLIALYVVWRRVFPGRRQDVNVNVILPENRGGVESDSNVNRIETRVSEEED